MAIVRQQSRRLAEFRLLLPVAALLVMLVGCASTTEPKTLAEIKREAVRKEYRECLRTMRRTAWWRNWDMRYMNEEVDRICSAQAGRRYVPVELSPPAPRF